MELVLKRRGWLGRGTSLGGWTIWERKVPRPVYDGAMIGHLSAGGWVYTS